MFIDRNAADRIRKRNLSVCFACVFGLLPLKWNYVNDFLAGRISRKQFWVLAEFRYPTHQMSFHTLSALNCLTYERSEIIYDRKGKK